MARTVNMQVLLVVVVGFIAAALLQGTEATQYTVGDSTGWNNPNGAITYATWAAKYNFSVGDVLVFNFATGSHDVATATQASFVACNTTNTLSVANTGPASITLSTTGPHYFFCTFSGHCAALQKLVIMVNNTSPGSSPTTPGTTVTSPPPPPPSSASSLVATFSVIFMSFVIALLF